MSGGTLTMAQGGVLDEVVKIVRDRQADIRAWQAENPKLGYRKIAQRLGVSESTYLRALDVIKEDAQAAPSGINKRVRTNTRPLPAKVYEGTPIHTSEHAPALLQEALTHLPALREMQEYWPVLKAMAQQWSEQQSMARIPEAYRKFNAFYTVRLSEQLIEAIKVYTKRHRLTQSEFITALASQALSRETSNSDRT
jgi:predicted DNA binding CopG/RHH family protein